MPRDPQERAQEDNRRWEAAQATKHWNARNNNMPASSNAYPSTPSSSSKRPPSLATSSARLALHQQAPPLSPSSANLTPSSARKRTFDALIATDPAAASPRAGPARAHSIPSTHGADLADAYRPTLYSAFLNNVFAEHANSDSIANASADKLAAATAAGGKRSPTTSQFSSPNSVSYNQLLAHLRVPTSHHPTGSASLSQLAQWLSALTHHVSKLDHRNHAELVEVILDIPWPTLGPVISRAWTTFVCSLLSARAEWLGAVLEHCVRALSYRSEWHDLPLSSTPAFASRSATRRHVYARVHSLLRSLLSLIPTLPTTLFPLLLANLPPRRAPLRTQGLYILNLLRVTEYAPELTEGIWAAVVHRVMNIDVEVQMEVEDLEDDQGRLDFLDSGGSGGGQGGPDEPVPTGVIGDILDRPLIEDDGDDVDVDSDIDPDDGIGDDILNGPHAFSREEDEDEETRLDDLSSAEESSDSDAEDRHGPPKTAAQRRAGQMLRQEEAIRSIKRSVKKLDVFMQILYDFLRRTEAQCSGSLHQLSSSGYFDDLAPPPIKLRMQKSSNDSLDRRRDDDTLDMMAGQMDEDQDLSDGSAGEGTDLSASVKLRRVESPSASVNGHARSVRQNSSSLFDPAPPSPLHTPTPTTLQSQTSTTLLQVARRTNLFHILLGIFDRLVLPTFRSRHVQFVLFWFSSLDAEYADTFLGMLLSKSLYSGSSRADHDSDKEHGGGGGRAGSAIHSYHANSHGVGVDDFNHHGGGGRHENGGDASSPILRKAAAQYVASLVSRASFIGKLHTRAVVTNLCAFLEAYMEQYQLACAAHAQQMHNFASLTMTHNKFGGIANGLGGGPPPPGSPVHDVFYSIAQALFYIYCFRWRDLEVQSSGSSFADGAMDINGRRGLGLVEASPQSNGPEPPAAGASLEVVQRVITSSLNPLRYCSPTVVRQFAHVAKVTGLVYCYSIIEANNRVIGSSTNSGNGKHNRATTISMTDSGTLKPLSQSQLLPLDVREDTPTRDVDRFREPSTSGSDTEDDEDGASDEEEDDQDDDDLPQPVGSDRLDGFFPFDPYRLQNSAGFVHGLYRQWEDVAPEGDDDDDEDTDDDDSDASSSASEDDNEEDEGSESASNVLGSSSADGTEDDDEEEESKADVRRRRSKFGASSAVVSVPTARRRRPSESEGGGGGGGDQFAQSFEAMSLSPSPAL